MSETPKRKRLTDEQWSLKWGASMPDRRAPVLVELRDDHHQAREDRKRLAEAFEKMAGFTSEYGLLCWCNDGPCFTRGGLDVLSSECAANNALLAEVDP